MQSPVLLYISSIEQSQTKIMFLKYYLLQKSDWHRTPTKSKFNISVGSNFKDIPCRNFTGWEYKVCLKQAYN